MGADDHQVLLQQLPRIVLAAALVALLSVTLHLFEVLIRRPNRLRAKLLIQGICGPPASFLLGNLREVKRSYTKQQPREAEAGAGQAVISHDCSSKLFPYLDRWTKAYGPVFTFSMGNIQLLYVSDLNLVREMSICTSLDFGKPSYQFRKMGPLLGRGILTSNGTYWARQRKIIAPELYPDKVKGMVRLMAECSTRLVRSWMDEIEREAGGEVAIRIDDHMRSFSGDVISRACFGSDYFKGEEIFVRLRALQEAVSLNNFSLVVPGLRYLPTGRNRAIWKLEKEVRSLIQRVVKERKGSAMTEKDLLQMILEGAQENDMGRGDATDRFIVDNCKNIYLAGYETAAVTATWTLMLLASHPEWQAKVRDEANRVCAGRLPDFDMIRKMTALTAVIHESLRLYPPVPIISREALKDIKFGDVVVPKGVTVWAPVITLHTDPDIWGTDASLFRPDRFANGVSAACRFPQAYVPFGVGARVCLGQNLAMAELKVLLSMIVSNFSFSLSPSYRHSPAIRLGIEPEHGVDLLVKKL